MGADINGVDQDIQRSVLSWACALGATNAVEQILEASLGDIGLREMDALGTFIGMASEKELLCYFVLFR